LLFLGVFLLLKRNRSLAIAVLGPALCYLVVVVLWGLPRERFVVPLLPSTFLAVAFAVAELLRKGKPGLTWAGAILFACAALWGLPGMFDWPPTRYYYNDAVHAERYASMKDAALQLGRYPSRPVLGYSTSLDGGLETVYWDRFPFIKGLGWRGLMSPAVEEKLITDFNVGYIWTDRDYEAQVRALAPDSNLIIENDKYAVFELRSFRQR
jgi:hypothetical protein